MDPAQSQSSTRLDQNRGTDTELLMSLMRNASYLLRREETELAERATQREDMGYATRLKRTAAVDHTFDTVVSTLTPNPTV